MPKKRIKKTYQSKKDKIPAKIKLRKHLNADALFEAVYSKNIIWMTCLKNLTPGTGYWYELVYTSWFTSYHVFIERSCMRAHFSASYH